MSVADKVCLSVLNSWDLKSVLLITTAISNYELQQHRRQQSWCTVDIWSGLNWEKPRKFSVNIADFQANTWISDPLNMKSDYTSPHMCMNVFLHIYPRGIRYLSKPCPGKSNLWQLIKNVIYLHGRSMAVNVQTLLAQVLWLLLATMCISQIMYEVKLLLFAHCGRDMMKHIVERS